MSRSAQLKTFSQPIPQPQPAAEYSYVELDSTGLAARAQLAEEVAIAISYNGINHAVMMVSPSSAEDFIRGLSLSSGVINRVDEIYDIHLEYSAASISANVSISNRAFWALKQQRRQLAGTSGCGLCGVAALEQALPTLTPLPPSALPPAAHLHNLRPRIATAQKMARHSGALHAALWVNAQGEMSLCREDIGRHNALDKLIGAALDEGQNLAQGFVVVTSRCSLELIHKAVRSGIATLVSLSAPTALTVEWARQYNLNLIHLPHHNAPRVFSPAPRQSEPCQ